MSDGWSLCNIPDVHPEAGSVEEPLGALLAAEALLLGVDDGVRSQVGGAPEGLAAGGAHRLALHILLAGVLAAHVQLHPCKSIRVMIRLRG